MEELMKREREFVAPGEKIVESMDYIPGRSCYRQGNSIKSKKIGIVSVKNRVISVIALNGTYSPHPGDMVIGEVKDIQNNGWVVDIGIAHTAYLPLSGVREFIDTTRTQLNTVYNIGDLIYAKITNINNSDSIHLSMDDARCGKFKGGRAIEINTAKVPRVIGREGSMIKMIKEKTGTYVTVGLNGIVWMEGKNQDVVIEAIRKIEKSPQQDGLTDSISEFLCSNAKPVEAEAAPKEDAA